MNIETARASIGKLVMSLDSGNYCRECPLKAPIGPFRIKQITKGGMAIVDGHHLALRPKWLSLVDETRFGTPERNWWQDACFENGNYLNTCCFCEKTFIGHKRRVVCRQCSESSKGKQP